MPATATRAVVSRALERSRTLRISWWPYFMAPARSAWPGLGRVTVLAGAPAGGAPTAMVLCQFSQSRLWIVRLTGLPSVRPQRTPEEMWTWSRSIFMRPPRPYPRWRRARSSLMWSSVRGRPAGTPSMTAVRASP